MWVRPITKATAGPPDHDRRDLITNGHIRLFKIAKNVSIAF